MKNGKGKIILLLIISIISINKVNASTLGINSASYTNNGTSWSNLNYWTADNRYDFNPYLMQAIRLNLNLTGCSSGGQYNFTFYTDPNYSNQSNMIDSTTLNGISCNVSVTQMGNAYVSCPNVPSANNYQLQFRPYTLPQSFTMGIVKEYSFTCGFDSNSIINNNNTNTNNIINNNNENTQDIIDNQNELLGDECANLFDKKTMLLQSGAFLPYDTTSTQIRYFGIAGPETLIIKLEPGKTYTITKKAGARFRVGFTNYSNPPLDTNNVITRVTTNDNASSYTFTMPNNMNYFVSNFYSPDQQTDANIGLQTMLNSIMINEGGTGKPYCEYGTYQSKLDTTNSAINDNTQAINDMTNADYNGATEQPDATDFNSYQQKEQTLENMASADMTAVNVGLNANASNWIWSIINRILNTNPILMAFYITILSIGVIKLIMRR